MRTRTEEWTMDFEGMTSTLVVEVHDGEKVHPAVIGDQAAREYVKVSPDVEKEFGLPEGTEDVDPYAERFFAWHPHAVVAEHLTKTGWQRVEN